MIICFVMLCSALDIVPSITVFRHFYATISTGDWLSFSIHHVLVEICDGISSSIKYWKEEFFCVHASAFPRPMTYGASVDRATDPAPELTPEEQDIVYRLS
ncbi:unnamed protein product [Lactuca virosa]|uniref:Uncharacterized protein n=1 Tax=Lactuca virosa TaxID=75947 RepID=A0AAU9MLD1_9ASTR|nr:unnamed protein product [Lactuca virosa]